MDRLLIVTDAWHPQVNGVVRTLTRIGEELNARGMDVRYLTPDTFWTMPMPTYPEIRLSIARQSTVGARIDAQVPDHVHIATEGPLGFLARQHCVASGIAFTTSYHTRFPEYLAARMPVPPSWSYAYMRWFHSGAQRTLVPTTSAMIALAGHGLTQLSIWTRGVDRDRFSPGSKTLFADLPGPHLVNVGRVAIEKNIEAFLALDMPGSKIVVGEGPQRAELAARYPHVHFLGHRDGQELVEIYRSADVFVFPSRTDTFGNVMIEAMACGTPVAAYPVIGPIDVVEQDVSGVLGDDLGASIRAALKLPRMRVVDAARRFSWSVSVEQFRQALVPARPRRVAVT